MRLLEIVKGLKIGGNEKKKTAETAAANCKNPVAISAPLDPNQIREEKLKQELKISTNKQQPIGPAVGRGGYLQYDVSSSGSLFLLWRENKCENSLAVFAPKKNVPDFKFKDKGGKQELIRNNMSDKKKYYLGWCLFFKTAFEFNSDTMVFKDANQIAPLPVDVYFLKSGVNVVQLTQGEWFSLHGVTDVAVVPQYNDALKVKTMKKKFFITQGNLTGAVISF